MIRTAAALAMRMAAIVRTVELDIRPQRFYDWSRNEVRLLLPGYLLTKKYRHVSGVAESVSERPDRLV
jgi:hypothetical protein